MSTTATRTAHDAGYRRAGCGSGAPVEAREQVVDGELGHPLARGVGRRADVGDDERGWARASSGWSARQRLGVGDVERGAGDLAGVRAPRRARRCRRAPPRAVLTRIAVGFIASSASRVDRGGASAAVSGAWSETTSARGERVARAASSRPTSSTSIPNARARSRDRPPDPPGADDRERRAAQLEPEPARRLPRPPLARRARPRPPPAAAAPRRGSARSPGPPSRR